MKDDLSEFVYFAAAAEKLELQFTARMARTAVKYCMYAYNCLSDKTPTVHPVLNGQDVAEDTLTLVKDISLTTDMLLKVEQMEASRREEEGDTLGEDGEGEEGEDAKEEQDEKEESEGEGEKNEEEKDEEEGEGEKDEDEDEKGQAGVEEDEEDDNNGDNQKRNPWSHHIDRKCMVPSGCRGYVGPNLKRHLQNVHYQKGHITKQDVDKYFALGLDPKKTRGPKRTTRGGKTIKGRWKR